MIFENKFV